MGWGKIDWLPMEGEPYIPVEHKQGHERDVATLLHQLGQKVRVERYLVGQGPMVNYLALVDLLRALHQFLRAMAPLVHVPCPNCGCSHVEERGYANVAHAVYICRVFRE